MKPLRILYISPAWPHDRCHGGQLRALHIARALAQVGEITMVIAGAHEVTAAIKAKSGEEFAIAREMDIHETPDRDSLEHLRSIFDRNYTNIHGVAVAPLDEAWLITAQKSFAITWFFKLRTANYFNNACWRNSVIDIDDLPSSMEQRQLIHDESQYQKFMSWSRLVRIQRHEKQLSRRFDVQAVCTDKDRLALKKPSRIHVIPNGFAKPATPPLRAPVNPPRIGFMGLYSYQPNLEGVRWFVERCWPKIKERVPNITFRLVGQDTDGPLKPDDPSVVALGFVDDPAAEVASWSLMIVPIQTGAGTRVKIADAFSRKCPLVSTRFGALGYNVQHDRELLLADEADDFVHACVTLIMDQTKATELAEQAYKTFLENWTWEAIAPRVWNAAEDCLRRNWGRTNS